MNLSLCQRKQDILASTSMTGKFVYRVCALSRNKKLSGVLFGNERLVRVFSTKQHIVDGQSVRHMDLVVLY